MHAYSITKSKTDGKLLTKQDYTKPYPCEDKFFLPSPETEQKVGILLLFCLKMSCTLGIF